MEMGPVPDTVWEGPQGSKLADTGSGEKSPSELEMPWAVLIFTVHFTGVTSVRMIDRWRWGAGSYGAAEYTEMGVLSQ